MTALKSLRLQNCFSHNNLVINFDTGLTAIIGKNGSGKSLILEMIRYCLYGSKALRGKSEDYKGLKAELQFYLDGYTYKVIRAGNTQELYRDDMLLATGAQTLNIKIPELLGYNLQVFDVANCSMQDQLNQLSDMRPSDRKAMVDSVIGLNLLDTLIDNIATKGREVEALAASEKIYLEHNKPEEPTKPEGYIFADILQDEYNRTLGLERVRQEKLAFINNAPPLAGDQPRTELPELEVLAKKATAQKEVEMGLLDLKRELSSLPPAPAWTIADIENSKTSIKAAEAYAEAKEILAKYPAPEHSKEDLDALQKQLDDWDSSIKYNSVQTQIDKLESGALDCPSCGHHFHPAEGVDLAARLAELKAEQSQYTYVAPELKPLFYSSFVTEQREILERYNQALPEIEAARLVPEHYVENLTDLRNTISEQEHRLQFFEKRTELEEKIAALEAKRESTDWKEKYHLRKTYEIESENWTKKTEAYDAWKKQATVYQIELQSAPDLSQQMREIQSKLLLCQKYESDCESYQRAKEKYEGIELEYQQNKEFSEQYKAARLAIKNAKVTVKQYLVPSLNKVASHLITKMTGGELYKVDVDPDFNVEVNGLPLYSLSGSGKAVANLAIRIGLGQVLTNKRFSLFMADEIDGSMDEDRAAYTAECLQSLTGQISQLLLVSHKAPEADHYISL